ncbi:head-binding protein, partial [Enterobacter roggenkampii]|nr:head-binding protein [Enterobacter roggenkampii]
IFNEDGSPHLNDKGEHLFVNEPVMQDVIEEYSEWINEEHEEEYTEPAAPEYENVLTVPAGSRYGIRYEEMLVLEAALQRRKHDRLLQRIEALEGNE